MKFTIAIDGPAASGKSSTAEEVAKRLDFQRIDSGSLYRAVTYVLLEKFNTEIDLSDEKIKNFIEKLDVSQLKKNTYVNGVNVTEHLKSSLVEQNVNKVAKELYVREKMKKVQREAVDHTEKGIVIDGRDIGTVIIPDAFLKIFITARDTTRARRRNLQCGNDYDKVLAELRIRDHEDATREHGPMKIPEDAIIVENDDLSKDEVVEKILVIFNEKRAKMGK